MSFTLQIEDSRWSEQVTPFSSWHWGQGSRVSQLTQLLPWYLWDVGPAVLVFLELGLPIFRQNSYIPDVREDFTFFQLVPRSQEPPVCLFSDFLASCLPWACVSICGAITGLCLPVPPDCCWLVYCSVFILASCSPWISSAGASLASSVNSPVVHSELYRPDPFLVPDLRLLRISSCAVAPAPAGQQHHAGPCAAGAAPAPLPGEAGGICWEAVICSTLSGTVLSTFGSCQTSADLSLLR